LRKIDQLIRRVPFTLITLLLLSLTAILTNSHLAPISAEWLIRLGFAPSDLFMGNLERLLTSALVTSGGIVFLEAFVMITICVGLAEWITSWKRAAATFWGGHLLVLILLSAIISLAHRQLSALGLSASIVARDVGPSAGYFACLGLVSARLKHPWYLVSGGIMLAYFVIALFIPASAGVNAPIKFSADMAHLLAFPIGWLSSGLGRQR